MKNFLCCLILTITQSIHRNRLHNSTLKIVIRIKVERNVRDIK